MDYEEMAAKIRLLASLYGKFQMAKVHKKHWSEYVGDSPEIALMAGQIKELKLPNKSLNILGMAAVRAQQKSENRAIAAVEAYNRELSRIIGKDPSAYKTEKIKQFLKTSLKYSTGALRAVFI